MAAEPGRLPTLSFFRTFWLTLALGVSVSACVGSVNPVTGERDWTLVDEQQELEIGHETHRQILDVFGYYDNPKLQEYVSQVGQTLVPHSHRPELDYRFTVLDSPVINAFATPGYVYITRGLLAMLNSEAELAGVLGHELAHITARHTARRIGQQQTVDILKRVLDATIDNSLLNNATDVLGEAYTRGYGRENELEADRLGARYAALAGYDPEALLEVMRILKDQETYEVRMAAREGREPHVYHGLFATHPDPDDRLQEVIREANRHRANSEVLVRRAEYLRHIDGMAIGSAESEGILRGRHFYHRVYNFTVTFPEGWKTHNLPDRLIAESPGRDTRIWLALLGRNPKQSACDFLFQEFEKLAKLRARTTDGYAGCEALSWNEESKQVRVVVLEHSPKIFLFAGVQWIEETSRKRYARAVADSIQSLRPMTRTEYEAARPSRIKIVEAKTGDTYAAYAKGADWDPYPEDQLRLFNAAYPSGEPIPGESVKTVH